MKGRSNRNPLGAIQQDGLLIVGCLAIIYFGYQYIVVNKAPSTLLNKDFVCTRSGVPGSQNPRSIIEFTQKNGLLARLQAPDQALQNEADRRRLAHEIVNLDLKAKDEPLSTIRNSLVVHVLDTDSSDKDVVVLKVRVLNKRHKGETWYIAANNINPALNVTGFADVAASAHKPGIYDFLENKDMQKALKAADK